MTLAMGRQPPDLVALLAVVLLGAAGGFVAATVAGPFSPPLSCLGMVVGGALLYWGNARAALFVVAASAGLAAAVALHLFSWPFAVPIGLVIPGAALLAARRFRHAAAAPAGALVLAAAAGVGAALLWGALTRPPPALAWRFPYGTWYNGLQPQDAYLRGKREARSDIAEGKLYWLTYGRPSNSRPAFARILSTEFGVELRGAAFCEVSVETLARVRGYNEIVEAEIDRRFGEGALARARGRVSAPAERSGMFVVE
jgi:hypothetical protein